MQSKRLDPKISRVHVRAPVLVLEEKLTFQPFHAPRRCLDGAAHETGKIDMAPGMSPYSMGVG